MNNCNNRSCVSIDTPSVTACTFPTGPRGIGIKSISQTDNYITVTYDDERTQVLMLPDWWFGTRAEFNSLSETEKTEKSLYFIEEGS